MNLPAAAVNRPVLTIMITLIIVTLGIFALGKIPLDLMPEMTYPTITITTTYENASPHEVEELITKPLEQALAAVPRVEEITSVSREGNSAVSVKFDWGHNLEEATNDIRDRLDRVVGRLPDDADRPLIRKFDTAAMPIMQIGVSSNLHPVKLRQFADDEVVYRLERKPGVASAAVNGGLIREIHVEVSPAKVKALNLDLYNLTNLIKAENLTEAGGDIDRGRLSVAVRTLGEFTSLEHLGAITIAKGEDGTPVRLRDIADIEDSWKKVDRITRVNRQSGVFIPVFKQSGANTVKVADQVNESIDEINETLPVVNLKPLIDSSIYIKRSLSTMTSSAVQGGALALLVILFFLQNIRSTLILGLAIPISIIATFMAMFFWGLTLNVITLGALALGVGMLVDNSIVVLENIFRLRGEGQAPETAAVNGAGEVAGAIIASTLTTLAVFLPMIFLEGMAGIMFRPFAWTICFALISSLAVALTLVPMMSGQHLSDQSLDSAASFGEPRLGRRYFKLTELTYLNWLRQALARPKYVLLVALTAVGLSLTLIPGIGTEFTPQTDESSFRITLFMEVGTRVEKTSEVMKLIEAVVAEEVPEMLTSSVNIGGVGGPGSHVAGGHTGELRVRVVSIDQRSRSVFEIMSVLRGKLSEVPGATISLRADQAFSSPGGMSSDRIQVELRGNDLEESDRLSVLMKKIIEGVPGVTDVYVNNEDATPEEQIVIDRNRAADVALSVSRISALIKTAVAGSTAGNYRDDGKEYVIRVSLKDSDKLSIEELMNLTITNMRGEQVALGSVARAVPSSGPLKINRKNQARTVTFSADYSGRPLGDVIYDINQALKSLPLPAEFSYAFAGEAKEQEATFQGLLYVLVMAVFLIYMVMAGQFEQFKGPFVVMFSVPFAVIGVIFSHWLTDTNFNINSFIGVIMLSGIVVNNAIILVDQANQLRRHEGMDLDEALTEAGRRRLRPILMTTLTTILGLVPLSLGFGEGGETQAPLARAVIGGLASSTFITLFVVPAMYKLIRPGVRVRSRDKQVGQALSASG
jgi:HAE1 family hydrophobic/amphiphilic exporter-1